MRVAVASEGKDENSEISVSEEDIGNS